MTTIQVDKNKRYVGRVTRVDKKGFMFISCKDIPFTRIFGHWSALNDETVHFTELKMGDEVEFNVIEFEDKDKHLTRLRAIKIDALEKE